MEEALNIWADMYNKADKEMARFANQILQKINEVEINGTNP